MTFLVTRFYPSCLKVEVTQQLVKLTLDGVRQVGVCQDGEVKSVNGEISVEFCEEQEEGGEPEPEGELKVFSESKDEKESEIDFGEQNGNYEGETYYDQDNVYQGEKEVQFVNEGEEGVGLAENGEWQEIGVIEEVYEYWEYFGELQSFSELEKELEQL
ncbi:MAG: hypothetical protein EZS28_029973 [Streblomastix strix]|uniref:Uncharacterized protein n=1 Tax=Streblomastix strix TaxID=222440 RepID=A0A5J4UWG4_9EUKA|nr:MAG: hypothetical protein EZS28_029973 [Streblomastix strix]